MDNGFSVGLMDAYARKIESEKEVPMTKNETVVSFRKHRKRCLHTKIAKDRQLRDSLERLEQRGREGTKQARGWFITV